MVQWRNTLHKEVNSVMINNDFLKKEDYEEPCCLLNMNPTPQVTHIPTTRVIAKLDEYFSRNDYQSAERHLKYWRAEAAAGNDIRGEITVLNEQIGIYRKTGKEKECFEAIDAVLALSEENDMENTAAFGTILVNIATGYKAFGKADKALPVYEKARSIYESVLAPQDERLGGLYNNMALALVDLNDFRRAEDLYNKALEVMSKQEHGEAEMAITYLNIADLVAAEEGEEAGEKRIRDCIDKAEELLDTESLPRNGYYAFVCEKCAPSFGYHGYFLAEQKFSNRAREIYERS
ncbi:MAG: tetratricopeptide repeat protein [Eubacteriales bacterium]